jgi:hypothetical protein
MRTMPLLALILGSCITQAHAGVLADVEVYDRSAGQVLPMYYDQGRTYVAGEPGHEFELRIHNHSGGRLLAVGSVDGVNVLSGKTASPDPGGYVLDPRGTLGIAGWRKSLQDVAAFFFTALPDSYAARTGRPDNVGVIGVALFRERTWCCLQPEAKAYSDSSSQAAPAAAPSARAAAPALEEEDRLGTGHGRIENSMAFETSFQRNSNTPDELISIWYDARSRLIAQGIIHDSHQFAQRLPTPFPGGFVPDP